MHEYDVSPISWTPIWPQSIWTSVFRRATPTEGHRRTPPLWSSFAFIQAVTEMLGALSGWHLICDERILIALSTFPDLSPVFNTYALWRIDQASLHWTNRFGLVCRDTGVKWFDLWFNFGWDLVATQEQVYILVSTIFAQSMVLSIFLGYPQLRQVNPFRVQHPTICIWRAQAFQARNPTYPQLLAFGHDALWRVWPSSTYAVPDAV